MLTLTRVARAWDALEARAYLAPDDVQAVAAAVLGHRLHRTWVAAAEAERAVVAALNAVAVPAS